MRILTTEKTGSTTTGTVGPKGSAYLETEKHGHETLFPDSRCGTPELAGNPENHHSKPNCRSYQYIEKLLKQPATVAVVKAQKSGPTEKELLKAKVVELSSKVEELSAELEAKAAPTTSSEDDKPPAKILTAGINLPPQTTEPEYDEEATFDDVVHYFESLDDDEQVQQIHKLCNELGLEFESSNL